MPKLKCKCQNIFEVSREDKIVECPVCGRGYKNPYYAEEYPQKVSNNSSQATDFQVEAKGRNTSEHTDSDNENTPLSVVRSLSKSVLMFLLAITVTITMIFTVIDLITHLKGILMVVNAVKIILSIVLCVGVWQIFINSWSNKRSVMGYRNVKGYMGTIFAFIMIIAVLILIAVFIILNSIPRFVRELEIANGVTLNSVLFIIIAIIIGVIVAVGVFFGSINGVLTSAQKVIRNQQITRSQSWLAAIVLIIIGLVKVFIMFVTNAVARVLDMTFAQISSIEGIGIFIGKIFGNVSFKPNWSTVLLDICGIFNYVLGGVLLIIYSVKMRRAEDIIIDSEI